MKSYIIIVIIVIGLVVWFTTKSLTIDETRSEVPYYPPKDMALSDEIQSTASGTSLQPAARVDELPFNIFMDLHNDH